MKNMCFVCFCYLTSGIDQRMVCWRSWEWELCCGKIIQAKENIAFDDLLELLRWN
jgi:hypothetical protein